ncbi:MAG: hypothetical protein ACYTAF_09380 [Planctomycetota bacterium]
MVVTVGVLAGPGASAWAQDKDAWKTAIRRLADAGEADKTERAAAVKAVGDATYPEVDERTVRLILDFLGAELKRSQGGRTEEKVSQEVLDACTEALKKIQAPDAIKYMVRRAASGPDARFGYHVVSALTGSKGGNFHDDLVALVDHKNLLIQAAAIEALTEEGQSSSLDIFIRVIADIERSFEVKLAALQGVKKLLRAEDRANIDRLIEAMGGIPDSQRRVAVEIRDLLNGLLGMNEPSYDPNAWRSALSAKGGGGAPAPAGGRGGAPSKGHMTTAEFFGIKSESTRIIFCLDRTGSMIDPCSDKRKKKKEPERDGVATGAGSAGAGSARDARLRDKAKETKKKYDRRIRTKMDAVKREYIDCVYNLDEKVRFTTIWYNERNEAWSTKLVPATWENKLSAINFADQLRPDGGTNIFGAIEMAFQVMGEGNKPVPGVRPATKTGSPAVPKGGNAGADTIYVLTDGKHNAGKFTTGSGPSGTGLNKCDTAGFLAEVRKINKHRKIIIHAICVGDPGVGMDPPDPDFLRTLAEGNGGTFRHVSGK